MSSFPVAPQAPAPAGGLSQIERVVDTFVAPSKTFADILRSTSWWLPFLLMVLSTTALNVVLDKRVGFDRIAENQAASSARTQEAMSNMTPEQKGDMMRRTTIGTKIGTYLFPVILLIILLIYSLIVWGSFNFGLGAQTTFPQVLAVTWYAALPYLFTPVIGIVAIYLGNAGESWDMKNPVGTNPGYYMPNAAPMVRALLSSLDIIKLWSVVLQAIGMAIIAKKTLMQSALVIGILWLLGTLIGVAAANFS